MEFFEVPVHHEPALTATSSNISRVHTGRLKASNYFFRINEARKNRKLWESLRLISDNYRMFMSQSIVVEVLEKDLGDAQEKMMSLSTYLDDLISKCALTYTSIETPNIKAEMLIHGDKQMPADVREKLILNCQLYLLMTQNQIHLLL